MTAPPVFKDWFESLTTHDSPRRWQSELADEPTCRDRLIRIPTGLGQTEGVLAPGNFVCSLRKPSRRFARRARLPCHPFQCRETLVGQAGASRSE